jgi:hypothetical protein
LLRLDDLPLLFRERCTKPDPYAVPVASGYRALALQVGRRQQTQSRLIVALVLFGAYMMAVFTFIGSMRSRGRSRQPAAVLLLRYEKIARNHQVIMLQGMPPNAPAADGLLGIPDKIWEQKSVQAANETSDMVKSVREESIFGTHQSFRLQMRLYSKKSNHAV